MRCALGRGALRFRKREGDGATPCGQWRLEGVYYRADQVARPLSALPVTATRQEDGWCDASADRNYNQPVTRPYPASCEALWRDDRIYDLVVVLSHNRRPRQRGLGSAIFMHVARPGYTPTEGCIALQLQDLQRLLRHVSAATRIRI